MMTIIYEAELSNIPSRGWFTLPDFMKKADLPRDVAVRQLRRLKKVGCVENPKDTVLLLHWRLTSKGLSAIEEVFDTEEMFVADNEVGAQ